jgi:threonine synthase
MIEQNMLTGVKPVKFKFSKEILLLREQVLDQHLSEIDRLEALEDITNLEVGDTSLSRVRNLEREYDIRQLYIKFEGDNPTGTQKDRIAMAQAYDALRRGFKTVVAATCGNYGVAVAYACYLAGLECKIYIPKSYHSERVSEMERFEAEVVYLDGSYEEVVALSSKIALDKDYYDANPGGQNTPLQIRAYSQIAMEIYDQLRDAPKYMAVPVSNGTLIAGVYRGFVNLYKRGKTSRIPHMIAGSSAYKNPIVNSFLKGHDEIQDLHPGTIKETKINEPLINWHSFDGAEALYALKQTEGFAAHVSDSSMKKMSTMLSKYDGTQVLPASTAGLVAFLKLHETNPLPNDRYVSLITARK